MSQPALREYWRKWGGCQREKRLRPLLSQLAGLPAAAPAKKVTSSLKASRPTWKAHALTGRSLPLNIARDRDRAGAPGAEIVKCRAAPAVEVSATQNWL